MEDKVKEICQVLVDKLYAHFVVNHGEAKVDTVVDTLEVLLPTLESDKSAVSQSNKEVDLI